MSVWTDTLAQLGYKFSEAVSKPRGKRVSKSRGGDTSTGHSFAKDGVKEKGKKASKVK